ncbi:MAG: hypothetical protein ACREQK_03770 [Candidatus Binatia bacterium]
MALLPAISKRRLQSSLVAAAMAIYVAVAFGQSRGTWATRAPMPSSRTEVAAVELAEKIYVMGG